MQALAQSTHPKAEAMLVDLLENKPTKDLADAIRASSGISTERYENALIDALRSTIPEVAQAAAVQLSDRRLPLSKEERACIKHMIEDETGNARCHL
jgi:hypothetical protein